MGRLSMLVVAVLAAQFSLAAQIYIVDPNGSFGFKSLQNALDTVPSGAILRVKGGLYGPLVVKKSVTIIGDPRPRIESEEYGSGGSGKQPPAITLKGSGKDTLELINVEVADVPAWGWNLQGEGIAGTGFSKLYIERSKITAMEWGQISGHAQSVPGIDVPTAAVHLSESVVWANAATTDISDSYGRSLNGAVGIRAAELVAVRSFVRGGHGSDLWWQYKPTTSPCYCPNFGSNGGDAVSISGRILATPNSLFGGRGGRISVKGAPWGQQRTGGIANKAVTPIQDNGTTSSPLAINSLWFVRYPVLSRSGILVVGTPVTQPMALGKDLLFVDPKAPIVFGLAASTTQWRTPVPNSTSLVGCEIAGHVVDFGRQQLSTPILRVVGF